MRVALPVVRAAAGRLRGPAGGAVLAQFTQALASFALQIAAARTLGLQGLGLFAVLYGSIVLATAITTGLVGDSLTVLARAEQRVRAGLQGWCLIAAFATGLVAGVIAWASGSLTLVSALVFTGATIVFVIEDALRRLLMAVSRFWALPVVDLAGLAGALAVLVVAHGVGTRLTVGTFMLALLVGQCVAGAVAIVRLPCAERRLAPLRQADLRGVFAFGFWRSAAQAVRPTILTAVRVVITAMTSVFAYGGLEAARVYMAPALLVVGGVGSFLLPVYVRRLDDGAAALVRRAERAATALVLGSLAMGVLATALVPLLGSLVTGNDQVGIVAVAGWSVYAAASAGILPFGSLAAVLGEPAKIMIYRVVETVLSVGAVAVVLGIDRSALDWTPLAMALGPIAGAAGIRRFVLAPLVRRSTPVRGVQATATQSLGTTSAEPRQ